MNAILDAAPGWLTEPIAGRHWDRQEVRERYRRRLVFLAQHGLGNGDRVFFHYGNTPEFFVDLIAVWSLGGCAVPIDARLTPFEVETLARAATPLWSLWSGAADADTARRLSGLGARVVDASETDREPQHGEPPALPAGSVDEDALILFTSGPRGSRRESCTRIARCARDGRRCEARSGSRAFDAPCACCRRTSATA
jgi:acyl-CoA synthetase (AMP-forming)/AMP-acid ligase II